MDTVVIKEFPSFANRVFLIETDGKSGLPAGRQVKKEFLVLDEKQIRVSQAVRTKLQNTIRIPKLLKNKNDDTLSQKNGNLPAGRQVFFEMSEYIPNEPIQRNSVVMYQYITTIGGILASIHSSRLRSNNNFQLATVDFQIINSQVQERIEVFLSEFNKILNTTPPHLQKKLKAIKEFIEYTESPREKLLQHNLSFYSAGKVLTHGDISLRNFIAPNDKREPLSVKGLFLVDWDNVALNSPMFELQRSIGTICGAGLMNGNLEAIDFDKVKILLKGYQKVYKLNKNHIRQLLEVAKYCYLIFWLHFTLQQVLKHDFRILNFVPNSLEKMLWWEKKLEEYKEFLISLIK